MTMTSSPPMRTSPTVTTVLSGLKVRLASLYGSEIRTTSCTPSSISISPASGCPCPTAPSTVRVTPVDRWTSMPISTRRATTLLDLRFGRPLFHHDNHDVPPSERSQIDPAAADSSSASRSRRPSLAVHDPALEPARFVDDPLEQPGDRVGAERALGRRPRGRASARPSRDRADRSRCPVPSSAGRSRRRSAPARSAGAPALRPRDRCPAADRRECSWSVMSARSTHALFS